MARRPVITALITDLDNTLWDWFEIWHGSFRAFLDALIAKTGLSEEQLLPEIKKIHERYGTAEYAFLLEELPLIQERYPGADIQEEFRDVIEAHRQARRTATRLYPYARLTLQALRAAGVVIIAYTESLEFYTVRRIRNTSLDDLLNYVYSPPDHDIPRGLTQDQVRSFPDSYYELKHAEHRATPRGRVKPAPDILEQIILDLDLDRSATAYVGDNLVKDVAMAQDVLVFDVHAKYGQAHNDERYDLLRAVTHWTDEMVQRERETTPDHVTPTFTLEKSFAELLDLFSLRAHGRTAKAEQSMDHAIEAWKQTVEVQKHFNDLQLKLRNLMITLLIAVLAAAGLAMKEKVVVPIFGISVAGSALAALAGIIMAAVSYFMDYGYHQLLKGAVSHGMNIEKRLASKLPEIRLATTITEASSFDLLGLKGWTINSTRRLHVLYIVILVALLTVGIFGQLATAPPGKGPASQSAPVTSPRDDGSDAANVREQRGESSAETRPGVGEQCQQSVGARTVRLGLSCKMIRLT